MNACAADLWERAKKALVVAKTILTLDPDATASRAYYAAFYAVSAWFALSGKTFTRHSGVERAVHRDLVKAGIWPKELGKGYATLLDLRNAGDYGGGQHVLPSEAERALQTATDILRAVAEGHPEAFGGLEECDPGQ